mgnify:CR=1 FL=1
MKKAVKKRIVTGAIIATIVAAIGLAVYYFRRKSTKVSTVATAKAAAVVKVPKEPFSAEITGSFDSFLNSHLADYGEALMVYVSKGNQEYTFKKEGNNFDEAYGIASMGKYLTAAAIMTLVDEGKLDLDKPLSHYLPWIKDVYEYNTFTVRQILAHRTTIVADSLFDNTQTLDLDGAIRAIANAHPFDPLLARPYQYSSTSYKFAARVAEVVSGQKWEVLFKQRIGDKCGMPNTFFSRFTDNPDVGKGAQSSLNDMARFMEMIRNNGEYNGTRVLKASSVSEMETLQLGSPEYGLGCWVFPQVNEVAAQGAFGARAWVNRHNNTYCVIMTIQNNSAFVSEDFKALVRSTL